MDCILRPSSSSSSRDLRRALYIVGCIWLERKQLTLDSLTLRKLRPVKSDGHHTWADDEIQRYEKQHPLGTRARLALALLIYTGQRRGDVVRMGRQHVRDGVLSLRQQKTGAQIDIPVIPDLQAALDAMPVTDHLAFLTTEAGQPFTAAGFGGWFRER